MTNKDRLAILIDADNAQAAIIGKVLTEIANYGTATVRRAYGDWTTPGLARWKDDLLDHAIQPIQQYRYTTGKNATDSTLIIDAMDLLHTGKIDGFCLISSDSDFTRLANRIREAGLVVYGFGEKKTPNPFVAACDKFIYTDILKNSSQPEKVALKDQKILKQTFSNIVTDAAMEDGWAPLSTIGSMLIKLDPSFDSRNFGFKKLGELAMAQDYLETKSVPTSPGSHIVHLHVRLKSKKSLKK